MAVTLPAFNYSLLIEQVIHLTSFSHNSCCMVLSKSLPSLFEMALNVCVHTLWCYTLAFKRFSMVPSAGNVAFGQYKYRHQKDRVLLCLPCFWCYPTFRFPSCKSTLKKLKNISCFPNIALLYQPFLRLLWGCNRVALWGLGWGISHILCAHVDLAFLRGSTCSQGDHPEQFSPGIRVFHFPQKKNRFFTSLPTLPK